MFGYKHSLDYKQYKGLEEHIAYKRSFDYKQYKGLEEHIAYKHSLDYKQYKGLEEHIAYKHSFDYKQYKGLEEHIAYEGLGLMHDDILGVCTRCWTRYKLFKSVIMGCALGAGRDINYSKVLLWSLHRSTL